MKIIIAPYSHKMPNGKPNPKNWSYWIELVKQLKNKDYYITQIGVNDETIIEGVDNVQFNLPFKQLEILLKEYDTFISVDSFFPHFAHYHKFYGTVIFTQSDPNIFGYEENNNLLKDRKYLRENQYWLWTQTEYNDNAFISIEEVLNSILTTIV